MSVCVTVKLAKLEVNRRNFAAARTHIRLVKEIDPDFCDVRYQEALVCLLGGDEDHDSAERHLVAR